MNYFVEGLQGSGKSTLVQRLSELNPDCTAVREGDYSPVELAWCAYMNEDKYKEILDKYSDIRSEIEKKTHSEGDKRIVCYTQIITDISGFHKDLERYEIYNNRASYSDFKSIILKRYNDWSRSAGMNEESGTAADADMNAKSNIEADLMQNMIFECSLFQNIVEDMILFKCASDDEIIEFYKDIRAALEGNASPDVNGDACKKDYHIFYLKAEDVRGNLEVIRKERSDDQGNELWFPLMMGYFKECPYSKKMGFGSEDDLIRHFIHRQELELRICREVFPDKHTVLISKKYNDEDIRYDS